MEQNTTTTTEEHAGAKMCQAGASTDSPCWRPATEKDIGEGEPTLCPEHMEMRHRGEDLDGWLHGLEAVRAFLQSEPVKEDPFGRLEELALEWHDTVTEGAANAAHKVQVARFLAEQGPQSRGPENPVIREAGAHLFTRSDAINDAYAVLIREREPSETERLVILAALQEAAKHAQEEYEEFRAKNGLDKRS